MQKNFVLNIKYVTISPDFYKYYILISSYNMIVGFNYKNYKIRPEYGTQKMKDIVYKTRVTRPRLFSYQFYLEFSNFKCISPAVIFFSTLNAHYNFSFSHIKNLNLVADRNNFIHYNDNMIRNCLHNKSVISYMNSPFHPDYLKQINPPTMTKSSRFSTSINPTTQFKLNLNSIFLSSFSESESIKRKTRMYLEKMMRKFNIRIVNNVPSKLFLIEYFPYSLSAIQPIENNNFKTKLKTYKEKKLIYLKEVRQSSIFRGIINRKTSGFDILNFIIIQGGRNVFLSNLFQVKHLQTSKKKKSFHFDVLQNKKIHEKGTFEYQIHSQKTRAKDIFSFDNALNLTNFYIQELGLKMGRNTSDSIALSKYWNYVDQDQKFLSRYSMEKDIIRINENEDTSECHSLKNEFLFRKKKNLMELATLKSKRGWSG